MADQPDNIFKNPQETPGQEGKAAPNADTNNSYADLLGSIKNERGEPKYKDVAEALNGLRHAQEYIATLKQTQEQKDAELARQRAEVDRIKELERVVQELTSKGTKQETTTPSAMSEEAIADLVNRALTNRETASVQRSNQEAVVNTLQEKFGAEAEKKFYDKAKELGLSVSEFNALAAKSPKAVLGMLGVDGVQRQQNFVSPTKGTVNTDALKPVENTLVGRNAKGTLVGATSQDLLEESRNAKAMVEELEKQGVDVYDLTDPKQYFKHFRK